MNFIQVKEENRYHDIVLDTNEMLKLEFLIKSFSCFLYMQKRFRLQQDLSIYKGSPTNKNSTCTNFQTSY